MIDAIAGFFDQVLSFIYTNIVSDFGLSIVLLTLAIKAVTFPLNNRQIQSAKRMQELQPEIKKIQQKYKHDKEKQNRAVMEFMQQHNVNPLAGCLPLLVQMPVLFGVFRLLSNAKELLSITALEGFSPYLIPALEPWGNLLETDSLYIFPIVSGITTFLYQKLTLTDPNQKTMLYVMPAIITFISFKFPAGLILYWTLNNILSIGQHYLVVMMGRKDELLDKEKDAK